MIEQRLTQPVKSVRGGGKPPPTFKFTSPQETGKLE
jgi:hypothetical protein